MQLEISYQNTCQLDAPKQSYTLRGIRTNRLQLPIRNATRIRKRRPNILFGIWVVVSHVPSGCHVLDFSAFFPLLLCKQSCLETILARRWEGVRLPFPRSSSATSLELLSLWILGARQRSGEGVVRRIGCPEGCFWRVRFFFCPLKP